MTMSDSPITDAIADAFARFDATLRDLPEDAEEIQKRINFNPHLHPRDPFGRFTSTGGPATPHAAPKPAPKTPSKRDWGYQDGERVKVVGNPPSGASGSGKVLGWTGRKEIFDVQLDDGSVHQLPMEHLQADKPPKRKLPLPGENLPHNEVRVGQKVEVHSAPGRDYNTYREATITGVVREIDGRNGQPIEHSKKYEVTHTDGTKAVVGYHQLKASEYSVRQEDASKPTANGVRTDIAQLSRDLKDEEGNAIGNPYDWASGTRAILHDGSYIGRDDQYPNALYIDEPGANVRYDVSPEEILDFARTKQKR